MSKKDRDGLSKREQMRERRRQSEAQGRAFMIAGIVLVAVVVAFFVIYPQLKPIAAIQPAEPHARPQVDRNSTGDPNAPVKLVEFSDYQCPFCKRFWQDTEPQIIETYVKTGKVQFTYRSAGNWVSDSVNSQLGGNDTESQDSAMAAYCAADQNKFWEMHDTLFTNVLGEADGISFVKRRLQAIAKNIGLDMSAFNSCYSSAKYLDQINQDLKDARAGGIQGTPYFLISYMANGQTQIVPIDGAQPFSIFQQEIDKALATADK